MSILRKRLTYIFLVAPILLGVVRLVGSSLDRRNWRRLLANMSLRIPTEQRMRLTNGAVDAVGWLEGQLNADEGSLVALYILDSLRQVPAERLPKPLPIIGFCGNTPKRLRRRLVRQSILGALDDLEDGKMQYFKERNHLEFRPLPLVDLNDRLALEGAFLAAVETRNLGMMVVLQDYRASVFGVHPVLRPSEERRVSFARAFGRYDVRQVAGRSRRYISYKWVGPEALGNSGRHSWISYLVEDVDGDGLPGIYLLRHEPSPPVDQMIRIAQPRVPSWGELFCADVPNSD